MNPILAAAGELQEFCFRKNWQFCFIGGLAVQRWGEPRNTQDAQLSLLTGFGKEEPLVDALLDRFAGRREDAKAFALRYRVLLLRAANGIPLDVALGTMAFEERCARRASLWRLPGGLRLLTCSSEDLIAHKAFAGRPRDWLDIEGVLRVPNERLNLSLVFEELEPLFALQEDSEALRRLKSLCETHGLRLREALELAPHALPRSTSGSCSGTAVLPP